MTFYEQELRKIVGEQYPDATYVGRACYVRLSDMNRAKIQFVTGIVANQYNALQMTILNRSEGQVDTLRLHFSDLLGTKATSNLNFQNGVDPHIWDDYGKVDWYVYHPTRQDYKILSDAVSEYLDVFQDSIEAMDDRILNFYVVPCFNVDKVFGTFVETDENDHALNIYANYDMQRQQVCDELEITLYGSGIEDQSLTYHLNAHLNAAEKEVLREKMEAYCMQREHMPLNQLCQEILQEQNAPTQEMQL